MGRPLFLLLLLVACARPVASDGDPPRSDPTPPDPLPPRDVTVRLVDAEGRAAKGMVWWAPEGAEFGTAVGTRAGVAVLKQVPGEPIVLVALPDGFVVPSEGWPRRLVPAGVAETTLHLDAGATRTLRVLDARQRFGAVYLAATTDLEPSHHGVEDDGTIHLEGLRPGVRYNLYVRERETGRCALLRGLSADEPWPEIELAQGAPVTGRILLPRGYDMCNVAVLVDGCVLMDGMVEEDGTFRIEAVPPGTWTICAYTNVDGTYVAATAEARTGDPVAIDLRRKR